MHLSKIFSFLSADTYSSLGVNFFRGLEFFEWIGRKEEKKEIDPKLKAIERAKKVIIEIYYPNPKYPNPFTKISPLVMQRYLDTLQECYNQLQSETDEEAIQIAMGLYVILTENGRRIKKSFYLEEDQFKEIKERLFSRLFEIS